MGYADNTTWIQVTRAPAYPSHWPLRQPKIQPDYRKSWLWDKIRDGWFRIKVKVLFIFAEKTKREQRNRNKRRKPKMLGDIASRQRVFRSRSWTLELKTQRKSCKKILTDMHRWCHRGQLVNLYAVVVFPHSDEVSSQYRVLPHPRLRQPDYTIAFEFASGGFRVHSHFPPYHPYLALTRSDLHLATEGHLVTGWYGMMK